ncbi:hypothetical protein KIW84_021594 [Lathyrus oleraceus]|uniref:Uncharacterized protein n=1 Tax=Pisum sativum TaxID=3888 RepID=A0A9D4Y907_PEA|nr:hypothetical protein KIW84_021594 [Pisum sativum]
MSSVYITELWGVLESLKLVVTMDFQKVILEVDSQQVMAKGSSSNNYEEARKLRLEENKKRFKMAKGSSSNNYEEARKLRLEENKKRFKPQQQ